jgi:hypothetical protein
MHGCRWEKNPKTKQYKQLNCQKHGWNYPKSKNRAIKTIEFPKIWLGPPNVQNGSAVPSTTIRWIKLEQNLYANCTTGTTLNDRE